MLEIAREKIETALELVAVALFIGGASVVVVSVLLVRPGWLRKVSP